MQDWPLTISCVIALIAGVYELYRTFKFYKYDKETKSIPTAPYVIYFGTFIGGVFIITSILFLTGTTNVKLPRFVYIFLGAALIIVAGLMYQRGHKIAKNLKKDESNFAVWQIYLISTVVMFTGIANLFRS